MNGISYTLSANLFHGWLEAMTMARRAKTSGETSALPQPIVQVIRPLEVEQGFGEGFQPWQGQGADALFLRSR